ncbi:unnamed protein product [Medioppia subpectinata]|uniref:Uncharacterized protein n=1 Tax=Medioppia subpectinata TaxID=1979941 RepID=A0A7R9KLP6_9ACAR|nr:unnamed protein product [Medioppia subpectinata]CAG2105572.1 unnamed protein product [Medioppia subpectinata]
MKHIKCRPKILTILPNGANIGITGAVKWLNTRILRSAQTTVAINRHNVQQHLTAPVVLDNEMNADMTDKTLSILRKMLRKNNTLLDVCRNVVYYMELEFGTVWTCLANSYNNNDYSWHIKKQTGFYMVFDWGVFKMRLKRNKIARKLDTKATTMKTSMVSVVTDIVFKAFDMADGLIDTPTHIKAQMATEYPDINNITERCEYCNNGCLQVVTQNDLKEHTDNCRYKTAQCLACNCVHTSGRDCIESLRAEIEALKAINNELKNGHGYNDSNLDQSVLPSKELSAHQILAECRQHLSTPVVLDNQLNADMTDKTLSIFREMLTKHNTLYDVCKHVVDYMDLEYGSSWHCLVDYDEYNGCLMIDHNYLFYWSNLKARLERNKIARKLDIYYTAMNESMVSFVTDIVFEAIDSNDNISATIHYIVTQMKARYPVREWQCFVYYRGFGDRYVQYVNNNFIHCHVDQITIIIFETRLY